MISDKELKRDDDEEEFSEDSYDSDDLAESDVSPVKKSSIIDLTCEFGQGRGYFAHSVA